MSDLISRSKVISVLEQLEEHSLTGKMYISNAIYLLKNQSTAYDIDKVVEELEKESFTTTDTVCGGIFKAIRLSSAIEIVKQGGVYDNVCEWKYTKEIMDNAEFKVGCNTNVLKRGVVPNNFSYHDFKYCPYCSKKIKVVE